MKIGSLVKFVKTKDYRLKPTSHLADKSHSAGATSFTVLEGSIGVLIGTKKPNNDVTELTVLVNEHIIFVLKVAIEKKLIIFL